MEAVLLRSSSNQSFSPCKHIRNPKRNHRSLISRSSENFDPSNYRGGLLNTPPTSLSFSYPPPASFLNRQQQPPLLPFPITKPDQNPSSRVVSCPPINRKINNRRDKSRTPKKSKSSVSPKKGYWDQELKPKTIDTTDPMGPDPNDLPKDVCRVLSSSPGNCSDLEKFSGSVVFTLSPPPSSLPLPTFSLRPKLCCNAEAAGIDAGATDNLRRLLRLR